MKELINFRKFLGEVEEGEVKEDTETDMVEVALNSSADGEETKKGLIKCLI